MTHRSLVMVSAALLNLMVTGCAGPASETGVGLTGSPPSSSSAARLSGAWHGHFFHPGADYTSPRNTNLTLEVREDSTYTFKWGNEPSRTGTLAAQGKRVILGDASGSQITLVHSGNTLHGVMKDSANGKTVVMSLEKVETGVGLSAAPAARPSMRSRLCEAAGGAYEHGSCQPITVPDWRARCEARGGTYFTGGEYCEVPAGGLRRM